MSSMVPVTRVAMPVADAERPVRLELPPRRLEVAQDAAVLVHFRRSAHSSSHHCMSLLRGKELVPPPGEFGI